MYVYYAAYFRRGAHEPIYLGGLLNGTASGFVYLHKVTTLRLAFYEFSRITIGDNQQTLRCAPALMTNSFVFLATQMLRRQLQLATGVLLHRYTYLAFRCE